MSTRSKVARACDHCRRKKARCDGREVSEGGCLTCVRYSVECSYDIPSKTRPTNAYVKLLEYRLASLEGIIQECMLRGNRSGSTSASRNTDNTGSEDDDDQPKLAPLSVHVYAERLRGDPTSPEETGDSDPSGEYGLHSPQSVVIQESFGSKFHGESSTLAFVDALSEKWKITDSHDLRSRRREFWEAPEWMLPLTQPSPTSFEFPEADLMLHLVECYFDNFNVILPILHRPSFVRSIEEGLHKVDEHFGAVVLMVCAIGCRCTTDPRVVQKIGTSSSCTAWKFFNQITAKRSQKMAFIAASVYKAQLYPLTALFLEYYCPPSSVWLVIGLGLSIMQENGVHRKTFSATSVLERELWKRAFWVLVVLDRYFSTILGRACGIRDEDVDAELPLRCGDVDLEKMGLDPPLVNRSPTQMCGFLSIIELSRILVFVLRTIYSTKRSRAILGYVGRGWEKHVVMALDSAMNEWVDGVPEHLRWGSEASKLNQAYLLQSAFLWCQFYETQLLIHRMIALGCPTDPERAAASMIICKNAAKRCIEIVQTVDDVLSVLLCSYLFTKSMFASSAFLLLMFRKNGVFDRDSPEYRATKASKLVLGKISERWRASAYMLNLLDVVQGMDDGLPAKHKVAEWCRPHLGTFLSIDKDGVLCHAEYNSVGCTQSNGEGRGVPPSPRAQPSGLGRETKVDGIRSPLVSRDSLIFSDLTEGMLWLNPDEGTDPGQHTIHGTFGTGEELVSPCSLIL
ncbi:fungal-specific transcription factor domain-containing protein [Thelephora terrestris]|uniref:Fungal-specific transcription factor domain-containing protein n=1 Tax=Thelephora terrestris TaxID=56493 RepID=A0A9P6H4N8_9AGAM|nr:fungal-specific transcription factor domain-containing protein [Thelephora terrestris]